MLELQHISYETEENREILHDISLTIQDRFVAITGPNGGGKSTLAKIIAGIYTPTSGRILLDGEDITALSITERARRGISYAFQQPVRFKGLRVGDLMNLAAGKDANIAEVCAYLSEVGLCARDYIDRELDASLSGGELKRIEIAMCWHAAPPFRSLMSRKPVSISGAFRISSVSLKRCTSRPAAASSLSVTRNASLISPIPSFC